MKDKNDYIEAAQQIIISLGLPKAQHNERSALCLLALLDLTPGKSWADAGNPLIGITPIMDWARDHFDKAYKPNTRESVRRQTMHQFCDAGLALYNPDKPDRPVNSPKAVYQIEPSALVLLRTFGTPAWHDSLVAYLAERETLVARYAKEREQNRIRMLNQGLQSVSFGQVNSVRLNVNVRETHSMLLDVLSEQHEQHQDLFNSNRLTFSEALAKLYQRLNPQIDMGQRTPQTIGEELLDYRNYLEMEVEVNRGSDGWLRAESGALSTGEAIGTGMSILVMVVQSWEDESRRLRGKDISPCRLLFLDEAARLDARSIATLFELCERLEMQLIIAAPENISPEKGTTYKLVRKVFNNHEHVHVVGLRGFAAPLPEALPGTADAS